MIVGESEVDVKDTKIFVGKLQDGNQVTVYSNNMDMGATGATGFINRPVFAPNPKNTAMILPFPRGPIQLYDMSNHKDIFKTLGSFFPTMNMTNGFGGLSYNAQSIEVRNLGSYQVSVVPSFKDFSRLQNDIFDLDSTFEGLLSREYRKDYGFLVCKIREGSEFHPMAYSHGIKNNKFYIPTRHYHNGSEENADWDHKIYIKGGNVGKINSYGVKTMKPVVEVPDSTFNNLPFRMKTGNLEKITVTKSYEHNHDMLIAII